MRPLFVILAAALWSSAVHAEDIDTARELQVAVNGIVGQRCAIGNVGNVAFGDLERSGLAADARVALDCNVPFAMTITGQSGALAHTQMPEGQGPYAGSLPYSLAVTVPLRHPSSEIVQRTFASRELQGGGLVSSNGGIATDGMTLSILLGDPGSEAGLLAGDYSETITITVSPV